MSLSSPHVIILAAGKGTRMRGSQPKVLAKIGDTSIIERLLDAVSRALPNTQPTLVVGYGRDQIKKTLGRRARYTTQTKQLGTGHAALVGLRSLLRSMLRNNDQVVVLYGDHPLLDPKLFKRVVAAQKKERAALAFASLVVDDFRGDRAVFSTHYGRVVRDARGRVVDNVEWKDGTPAQRKLKELNIGYYCFNAGWLKENLTKLSKQNAQGEYYLNELIRIAVDQGDKVVAVKSRDWRSAVSVNSPRELAIVNKFAKPRSS